MNPPPLVAVATLVVTFSLTRLACANDVDDAFGFTPMRLHSRASCTTRGGTMINLDPGVYMSEEDWSAVDAEIKGLENTDTRLEAENTSLRRDAANRASAWTYIEVGVGILAVGLLAGAGATLYLEHR